MRSTPSNINVGFCTPGSQRDKIRNLTDERLKYESILKDGYEDASLVRDNYGNLIRIPLGPWDVDLFDPSFYPILWGTEVNFSQLDLEDKIRYLDQINRVLSITRDNVKNGSNQQGCAIDWLFYDAYSTRISKLNSQLAMDQRVRVLLLFLPNPPRFIIECLSSKNTVRIQSILQFQHAMGTIQRNNWRSGKSDTTEICKFRERPYYRRSFRPADMCNRSRQRKQQGLPQRTVGLQ